MKNKTWNILLLILLSLVTYLGLVFYLKHSGSWEGMDVGGRGICLLLSLLPSLILMISDMNRTDAQKLSRERKKVQNSSKIPKELLKQKPEKGDFILGERNGKYVCTSIKDTDTHYSIIGTSGTGKTSCYLLNNLILNDDIAALVLDVKDSELFRKSTKLGDANVEKFDPSAFDGSTWGFDPFYRLHQGCTDFEILDSMQIVANSLIPMLPDTTKDPFWKNNAKNMFLGLAIKFYKDGSHDLVSISDKILGKPIEDNIDYVLGNSQPCDAEYKYLIMFQNMEAVTLYGVYAELASNLTVFANHPGIRYAFGPGSRKKITPLDLEEKKRIFICVNETEITTLSGVTKMILDVMLYGLQMRMKGREESTVDPVFFVIDELPQLLMNGPLNQLIQGLRVLRSFKVRMVLAFQTRESLETAFSSSQVTDLISNTNYMIVLNGGNSTGTLKMICDLVGQFKEKHESYQGAGNNRKTTVSYEDKDIIEPSDINRLPLENKALILSPTGWMIVKKSPYYKCKYLAGKAEEILRYNKNVMEAESQAEAEPEGRKTQVEQQLDLWCTYKKREMKKGEKENDE